MPDLRVYFWGKSELYRETANTLRYYGIAGDSYLWYEKSLESSLLKSDYEEKIVKIATRAPSAIT